MKYLFIISMAVSVWCYYLNCRVDALKEENARLESEKNALAADIQRRDKNDLEKSSRQEQANELAKSDKSGFDWSYDISGNPLVVQLRKDCKSCSAKTDKLY